VTGPTCDSEDTLFLDVPVPEDLGCGDRLYILTAGAYTTAYASRFNGFDVPRTHCVPTQGEERRRIAAVDPLTMEGFDPDGRPPASQSLDFA
jgi:hypothetical protein